MSLSQLREHPILAAIATSNAVISGVTDVAPLYMRVADQAEALTQLLALEARVAELKARLTVALDAPSGVVEQSGARDLAFWLVQQARMGIGEARRTIDFAHRLARYPETAGALRDGAVSREQAEVIMAAVDALPVDLPAELVAAFDQSDASGLDVAGRAELQLLADAAVFEPRRLKVLGRRILEVIAPDRADEAEGLKLEASERRGRERIRLTLSPLGDGTTRIAGRIPDLAAAQLQAMLGGLLSPRRAPQWAEGAEGAGAEKDAAPLVNDAAGGDSGASTDDECAEPLPWWALPGPQKLGHAFCELLERINTDELPRHGTTPTTLFVTVTLDQLRSGLGAASVMAVGGEELISASEARRLACKSRLIPAVLGKKSEVLDLGRGSRLFTAAQKMALMLKHPRCQAEGCDQPASHTEVHHHEPWSGGGATDLANAVLLCIRDHHRAHDPTLLYEKSDDGVVQFSRRQ